MYGLWNGNKTWFVGYVIDVKQGICTIEHLDRVGHRNGEWKYPVREDIYVRLMLLR